MKRKFFSVASVAFACLTFGYLFFISWLPSYLVCKYLSANEVGQRSRVKSIIIPLGRWKMHLHHWICSLGIAGLCTTTGYYLINPAMTYGVLGGLAFQGVYCYSDWNRVLFRSRRYFSKRR